MGFLSGKRALIAGVASNRSIAWGIAQAMHREGAELAFSYPNEKFKPRVEKMVTELGSDIVLPCDVASDEQITGLLPIWANTGMAWIFWCILLRSHRQMSLRDYILTLLPERDLA